MIQIGKLPGSSFQETTDIGTGTVHNNAQYQVSLRLYFGFGSTAKCMDSDPKK